MRIAKGFGYVLHVLYSAGTTPLPVALIEERTGLEEQTLRKQMASLLASASVQIEVGSDPRRYTLTAQGVAEYMARPESARVLLAKTTTLQAAQRRELKVLQQRHQQAMESLINAHLLAARRLTGTPT